MLQASAFAHSAPSVNVIPSSAMVKESIYLCKFLVNLGHPSTAPTPVFADNETCIAWSEGSQGTVGSSECAARIDLHFHSVHEGHAAGHLKLCSLSKVNATDCDRHSNQGLDASWCLLGSRPQHQLPAALCQHSHKQDASDQWGSKRKSILKNKFCCWVKYCQMEQKTWLKCMIVTDKPEFNGF